MLSFELAGGEPAVAALLDGLDCFTLAESLGGVESLIAHPSSMTHAGMEEGARRRQASARGCCGCRWGSRMRETWSPIFRPVSNAPLQSSQYRISGGTRRNRGRAGSREVRGQDARGHGAVYRRFQERRLRLEFERISKGRAPLNRAA